MKQNDYGEKLVLERGERGGVRYVLSGISSNRKVKVEYINPFFAIFRNGSVSNYEVVFSNPLEGFQFLQATFFELGLGRKIEKPERYCIADEDRHEICFVYEGGKVLRLDNFESEVHFDKNSDFPSCLTASEKIQKVFKLKRKLSNIEVLLLEKFANNLDGGAESVKRFEVLGKSGERIGLFSDERKKKKGVVSLEGYFDKLGKIVDEPSRWQCLNDMLSSGWARNYFSGKTDDDSIEKDKKVWWSGVPNLEERDFPYFEYKSLDRALFFQEVLKRKGLKSKVNFAWG